MAEPRRGRQPARLPAHPLREGADAPLGPLPRLLHGARQRRLELQLHGRAPLCKHEIRPQVGKPEGVLPPDPPALALSQLLVH